MSDSPTARALRALEVLQSRPGITADELAERLGVTDRAARRYVAILREAGIPVESVRGKYGGYTLGRGLRLPPLVFTATEALGLVMAALDGHHAASDADDPVGSALGKILRVLPEAVGRQARTMREHAQAAPARGSARPDLDTTAVLVTAVAEKRQLRISYRSPTGTPRDFVVDPWAVVVRHGLWYLLCRAHHVDDVRTYRVDRVRAAHLLDDRCEVPADLDPVAELERRLGTGWEHETRVRFLAPYADVAPWIRPVMGRLEPLDDDSCLLVGSTNNPGMYAGEWLAGIPFELRVEGGDELRTAVAGVAARLARAAGEPAGEQPDPDRR